MVDGGTDKTPFRVLPIPAARDLPGGPVAQYAPPMELSGTAAIISGGASGLGEAAARELATAGSAVVIADLNEERGRKVADETGGEFVRTDVSDEAAVATAVEAATAKGVPLRVVANCAGI